MIMAHNKLSERNDTLLAILREMVAAEGSGMSCMHVPDLHDVDALVQGKVQELAEFPSTAGVQGDYKAVRHLAQQPRGARADLRYTYYIIIYVVYIILLLCYIILYDMVSFVLQMHMHHMDVIWDVVGVCRYTTHVLRI